MIVELTQSARWSVPETTYFGIRLKCSRSSAASSGAVGQKAAQIWKVFRPNRSASAESDWARL